MKVAVIGGTGKLGKGLAARVMQAGHEVVIGSRNQNKAEEAAAAVGGTATGRVNGDAARWCELAILAIPYQGRVPLLDPLRADLRHKVVIDTTVPIDPSNILQTRTDTGTSAGEETATTLDGAEVFAAFHTVSHRLLRHGDVSVDVLVAGSGTRTADVLGLIRGMGFHPVHAGPLPIARLLEGMTVLMLSINRQNHVKESGIRVTGLGETA